MVTIFFFFFFFFFLNINILSICPFPAIFALQIIFNKFSPIKCMGDLCWPCRKIGQGHPRVMIYTNFVELDCLMLHAKFQNHRPSRSGEEDLKVCANYSHGGHLGHVTLSIFINFHCPFLTMLHIKYGFDWPSGFWAEDVWILWSYTCI